MAGCTRSRRLVNVSLIVIFVLLAYTTTTSALGLSNTDSLCHGSRRCLQQFEFGPPSSAPASEPAPNDPLTPDNSPPALPAGFLGSPPSPTPEPQPVLPAPTPSPVLPGPAPTPEQTLPPPSPLPLFPAPAPTPVGVGPAPVIPPFGSVSPMPSLAPAVLPPTGGLVPVVPSPTPALPPKLAPTVPSIAPPLPGTDDSPPSPPTPTVVLPPPSPAAASSSESSNKSTVKTAVGATVGVSLFALVALGLIVFFKPEWLPCCGEDRRRQAQYERHITDF